MSATKSLRRFILFSLLSLLVPFTASILADAVETDHTWSLSGTLGGPGSTNYINLAVENAVVDSSFGIEFYWGTTVLEPAHPTSGTEG
ncbi:MAG: hypothetical protein JXQ83_11420, partial [Candidatus Glassbacteria bacterium]|nr:hypothetical protein [Candidatus Glassbacteria bacterium]